ncbi:MAG: hypothetical protein DIZ79_14650, partial [endosymbiont of Lamellibrachia luymesi]
GTSSSFQKTKELLTDYFTPKSNVPYNRHMFHRAEQHEGETVGQFVTRLRQLASSCDYGNNVDEYIRDQVIDRCRSDSLRTKLLAAGKDLTLNRAIEIAQTRESSERQAKDMARGTANNTVYAAFNRSARIPFETHTRKPVNRHSNTQQRHDRCTRCGLQGHTSDECKCTRDKECHKCGVRGHFAVMCRSKPRQQSQRSSQTWQKKRAQPVNPIRYMAESAAHSDNPADYLSRHPATKVSQAQRMAEDFINHIADSSTPNAITLDEIKVHTRQDATLNKVIEVIRTGRWHDTANNESADIAAFRNVRDELTVGENGDFLLRDSRIVIPTALRSRVIQLAHEGHQGICKTKALIRSKVWFPGIDKETEAVVMGCIPCVANSNRRQMEPLNMTTLPRGPWINLSIDFCGPMPTGEYLLCVTDEYSRYPVVHVTRSTSAETVIPIMESIFAMFGYPETIKSDNGPPFQSNAWSQFLQSCGVRHRKITPLWPMANAQVENFNKPMMKAVRSAIIQHRNWRRELQQFLRNYRSTPHSSTLFTPHRLLFGREPRTKLPELPTLQSVHPEDEVVRRQDARAKARMKEYSDKRAHASHVNLQ